MEEKLEAFLTQLLLVLAFLASNTAINVYNKWLFTPVEKDGAGFTTPVFSTITHAVAGFITAFILRFYPIIYSPKEINGSSRWIQVMIMSVFFAATIGFNNQSLVYLPLSVQQSVRACSPVAIALASYLIEDHIYSIRQMIALFFLVFGIVLTVLSNDEASSIGLFYAGASVVSGALYYVFISLHLASSENKLNILDILYYTSLPVVFLLLPIFLVTDEAEVIVRFGNDNGFGLTLLLILIGCFLAVTYNLLTFKFIQMLSAVYLSVVANFKLVILIILGILVFGEDVGWLNALGLTIATIAFCIYSYFEYETHVHNSEDQDNPKKVK